MHRTGGGQQSLTFPQHLRLLHRDSAHGFFFTFLSLQSRNANATCARPFVEFGQQEGVCYKYGNFSTLFRSCSDDGAFAYTLSYFLHGDCSGPSYIQKDILLEGCNYRTSQQQQCSTKLAPTFTALPTASLNSEHHVEDQVLCYQTSLLENNGPKLNSYIFNASVGVATFEADFTLGTVRTDVTFQSLSYPSSLTPHWAAQD